MSPRPPRGSQRVLLSCRVIIVASRAPPECFNADSGTLQVRLLGVDYLREAAPALPLEEMSVDCLPLVGELYGRPDR